DRSVPQIEHRDGAGEQHHQIEWLRLLEKHLEVEPPGEVSGACRAEKRSAFRHVRAPSAEYTRPQPGFSALRDTIGLHKNSDREESKRRVPRPRMRGRNNRTLSARRPFLCAISCKAGLNSTTISCTPGRPLS